MKKKLNLEGLKVKSFVTDLENKSVDTVKGGGHTGPGSGGPVEDIEYDPNRPNYTRVHNCNLNTSLFRCPTQNNVGACASNNSPC